MNDEEACIGVVARCPELGYLAYRIASSRTGVRLTMAGCAAY